MLLPCPSCRRHVRQEESECPFCAATLDLSAAPQQRLPTRRLGRAATFAFGATVVSATALASCGGKEEREERESGGAAGMSSAGSGVGASVQPVYGVPPDPDAGLGGTGGSTSDGGSTSNGGSGTGGLVDDGGGVQPLYGAVPAGGAGTDDTDGGLPGPVYGAPP